MGEHSLQELRRQMAAASSRRVKAELDERGARQRVFQAEVKELRRQLDGMGVVLGETRVQVRDLFAAGAKWSQPRIVTGIVEGTWRHPDLATLRLSRIRKSGEADMRPDMTLTGQIGLNNLRIRLRKAEG